MFTRSLFSFGSARCLLLTSALALSLSAIPVSAQEAPAAGEPAKKAASPEANDTYRQLSLFGDVFEQVRSKYVEEVTDQELVEAAVNGMLTSLDPHSSYLNEDSFKDMQVQTKGEFGGLGIEVTMENGVVKVVSPIDDTPAFRAGMKAGDFITHVDGKPLIGLTLNEAVDILRGKIGSVIELTVRREGVAEPLKMKLTRDRIEIRSVRSEIKGDVGYIRITQFNQNTEEGLKKALADIHAKLGKKALGIVLDLRNNPGGLLDQAIAVSDAFLERGEIVSTRGRNPKDTKRDNATPGDLSNGLPVVVLINSGSASASEIVAGALQDHRRALLVGTRTFGKGSVQTIVPLPGHGAMRLTTARYFTPSGRSIQAKGIEPDILLEQAKIETIDTSLHFSEADYRGALSNPDDDKKAPEGGAAAAPDATKGGQAAPAGQSSAPGDAAKVGEPAPQDYQLDRAIDLLRGIALYSSAGHAPAAAAEPAGTEAGKGE